jgi:hypothetical protein
MGVEGMESRDGRRCRGECQLRRGNMERRTEVDVPGPVDRMIRTSE